LTPPNLNPADGARQENQPMKINEIFFSIQGESTWVGQPTVFVRTSGCHLRCRYCDTTYAFYEGRSMTVDEVVENIQSHPARYVCLTGGEPMLQSETPLLLQRLCDLNFNVSLETSGGLDCSGVDARVKLILDVKTPDSGAGGSFDERNLSLADVNRKNRTEFKFVICSESDFDWAVNFAQRHQLFERAEVLMSPAYRRVDARWLAGKILSTGCFARLQTQLHKSIWSPHVRGV